MALLNTWASQQDQATLSPLSRLLNNYIQQSDAPLAYLMRGDAQGLLKDLNTPKPVNITQDMTNAALNANPTIGLLGTFIGKGSKLWNSKTNDVAKALEKEGLAPETIWSQTGNVKAPDGKWRQEISDAEAMALQYPKDANMSYLEKYSQELYNKPYGQLPFGEKGIGEQREKVSKLANAEMKKYEQVGTTLTHPKLYESYPNLKDIELSQWIGPREGSYYPKGRSNKEPNPYITVGAETPEQLKSTLLHELQHGIQMNEGFARGGSPTEFINNPTVFGGKFLGIPDLDKAVAKKYNVLTPMESYQRLLGEAESRLTQTRIPLTQEQRLQYYPYAQGQYGLDVPYNELIVKGLLD